MPDNSIYPESIFGTPQERLARAYKWGDKKQMPGLWSDTKPKNKYEDDFPDDRNMNSQHVLRGFLEVNKEVVAGYKNFKIVRKNLTNIDIGGFSGSNRFWVIYGEVNAGTVWTLAILPYNIDVTYKYRHIGKELPISKQEVEVDFQIETLGKTIATAQEALKKYQELKKGF